jgi:hypothetical protein
MKNKISLNLNINKDDSSINDFLYCWNVFESRPNKVLVHDSYLSADFLNIIEAKTIDKNEFTEILPDAEGDIINTKTLAKLSDSIFISYVLIDKNQPDAIVTDITFFYESDDDKEEIESIIESLVQDCEVDYEESEINKLNTIGLSNNGLELERVETKIDLDAIELFYNNKTMKDVNKLIKKIKKSQTGISILHGERGTGKTSIVHYLATKLDRIVIFVPNNMLEHTINNPDFRKFIKKYNKVLLVLDDCEMSFNEYFVKSNFIVNNLLQLVDGFLSDSIDLSIVAIFNVEDSEEIDHNLLNCNNLIDVINFDELSESESNELADHLGDKTKYKNKAKLIDIIKKRKVLDNKKLGF